MTLSLIQTVEIQITRSEKFAKFETTERNTLNKK